MNVNLEAYKKKDLQTFKALLSQYNSEGVLDTRTISEHLENYSKAEEVEARHRLIRNRKGRKVFRIESVVCPKCGFNMRELLLPDEPVRVRECSKCWYSEVIK